MVKKKMALCQRPIWLVFLILSSSHYLLTEQNPAILSDTHCNCNCKHCNAFHTLARPLWLKLSGKNIQWTPPLLPQSWDCGQKLSFVGVGVHSIQNMAVWTIKMQKDPQRPETTASFSESSHGLKVVWPGLTFENPAQPRDISNENEDLTLQLVWKPFPVRLLWHDNYDSSHDLIN